MISFEFYLNKISFLDGWENVLQEKGVKAQI